MSAAGNTSAALPESIARRRFLQSTGVLVVGFSTGCAMVGTDGAAVPASRLPLKPESVDSWLTVAKSGEVTVYSGKIDMGTGIRTAFAQIVADELEVPIERVRVELGDTERTPDQGKSTASSGIVMGAQPLRVAAAAAREALIGMAATRLGVASSELEARDGSVRMKSTPARNIGYGELIGQQHFAIDLAVDGAIGPWGPRLKPAAALKPARDYRVIGRSVPRPDVPLKVAGTMEYVHNLRLPGMLHGRIVRPPAFGATLQSVDESSVSGIDGAQVIRRGNFLGVVAPREEDAIEAARRLTAQWSRPAGALPDSARLYESLRAGKEIGRENIAVLTSGNVEAALTAAPIRRKASYDYANQLHAMLGPSCAVADVKRDGARVWSGSQWPHGDRSDLAAMLGLPLERVHLVSREASGCYGRLGCDDAAADAALLSQAVGRPVRVQWMRGDEHGWEPLSPALTMDLEGAVDANGRIVAFDLMQWLTSHATGEKGNSLAWRALGTAPGHNRLSGSPNGLWYEIAARRARAIYVEPPFRAIYLRAPGGIQYAFALESFVDELAHAAGADPIAFRLRHLTAPRDRDVLQSAAKMADWRAGPAVRASARDAAVMTGRGVAMARYGMGGSRVAIVADVAVERASGVVRVERMYVAHDCGIIINPDGLLNQVEGGVVQGVSRSIKEEVQFDRQHVTSLDWESYPILRFSEVPELQVDLINRPAEPPSAAGEISTVPVTAAIGNAIYNATGRRLRQAPFTPRRVLAALAQA